MDMRERGRKGAREGQRQRQRGMERERDLLLRYKLDGDIPLS